MEILDASRVIDMDAVDVSLKELLPHKKIASSIVVHHQDPEIHAPSKTALSSLACGRPSSPVSATQELEW